MFTWTHEHSIISIYYPKVSIIYFHHDVGFIFLAALNDALKEEIQHLKVMTGQAMPNGGPMMNFASFGGGQQFYPNSQAMHTLLTTQQFQQLQIHSQKPQQHQFQQHQLHQLQQQHMQQEQQQQSGDLKISRNMPSPGQKDNPSDVNSSATKES